MQSVSYKNKQDKEVRFMFRFHGVKSGTPLAYLLHPKRAWIAILLKVTLALALPLAGAPFHSAAYILLAGWALSGPRRAIEALTLVWMISFLNPGIYNISPYSDLLRWLVVCSAFVSVMVCAVRRKTVLPLTAIWLLVFCIVAAALSYHTSYALLMSLFKLSSFFISATTVILGFHLTRHQAQYWKQWFLIFFGVILVFGFPLIILPLGYVRNGRGFQGLLNHPQTYGSFIAPFLAWLIALLLTREVKGWMPWSIVLIACVSLFTTQARVGLIALIGGLLVSLAWRVFPKGNSLKQLVRWVPQLTVILGVMLSLAIVYGNQIAQSAEEFVKKGQIELTMDESLQRSRGLIIERSMSNFYDNKLTGIGFGVASDPFMFLIRHDPLFGLPVGASVEKGFIVSAVLEEVGLVGFICFIALLGSLFYPVLSRSSNMPAVALALGAFFINFGESVFFSLGGIGLLVWLLIGAARVTSRARS